MEDLAAFHFLRPLWLLALVPLVWVWWVSRPKRAAATPDQDGVAPHLARALEVGSARPQRIYPIDGVALLGVCLALAVAGPTWSRLPNPLVAETAPLVVALKVTPSMDASDLAPSRLERARFKILDVIAARAGARTALVAYAGSAHQVAPLTEDPGILQPLVQSLTPQTMPVEGADAGAALALAEGILSGAETPGAVLFVLDDLNPADVAALGGSRFPLVFLVAAPADIALPQLEQVSGATVLRISADDQDVRQIERQLRSAQAAALVDDERLQWNDRGWWLAWPAALIAAFWFRRGWTMRWAMVALTLTVLHAPGAARADGWRDWFLTPDQQGRLAYQDKRYAEASERFIDPMWKGMAHYKAGQYEEAAEVFGGLETAEAAFAQGMAQIKGRQYRPAVASFQTALQRRPDYPEAARNLEVAQAIVEFVETTREQSDTGEEAGIGADEVVFDNEASRGAETQIDAPDPDAPPVTAEQWIDSIDTDMGDFLRARFVLENAGDGP